MEPAELRVLVVEDDVDAAEIIAIVVEGLGCSCRIATTLHAARQLVDTYSPDLLILDEQLGDGSGSELARSLRGDKRRIYIISFSGCDLRADDFDACLHKPISVSTLRESVRKAVARFTRSASSSSIRS
jgi:DNA-binding response OmpR family regulator